MGAWGLGRKKPVFVSWLKSDGSTGYVDTGFVVSDYRTRLIIEAAYTGSPTNGNLGVIVYAGTPANAGLNATSYNAFGFAPFYGDRQFYMRIGNDHAWNTTSNSGNWNDDNFHVIEIGAVSTSSITGTLDGDSITMNFLGSASKTNLPSDSQTIFASKYNGTYSHFSVPYKIRRVGYKLDGVTLADFHAARIGEIFGFYNVLNDEFIPGTGTLFCGDDL